MPSPRLAPMLAAALLGATLLPLAAQSVPTLDLGKRSARSRYTLGHIHAMQELPDGRVVASDTKEGVFRVVDLAKGDVGLIGTQGDGADEYQRATAVFSWPGDSLLLYDAVGRKFLHVTPSGAVAEILPFTMPTTNRLAAPPSAADASGNIYLVVSEFDTAATAMSPVASIQRWSTATNTAQEVGRIHLRRADQARANGILPFAFRDAWAVRQDGLVARVMADSYQVIWSRNGTETGRTGALAFQPIPITPAEQQAVTDSIHQGMKPTTGSVAIAAPPQGAIGNGQTVAFAGGGGGEGIMITRGTAMGVAPAAGGTAVQTTATPGQMRAFNPADIPIAPFPPTKPAIPSSGIVALFDQSGALWVARERARGDATPHYDVIAEGKGVVAHVNLPAGTRLVGFGKGVVYLARVDDGSDWLERYAMPKM